MVVGYISTDTDSHSKWRDL